MGSRRSASTSRRSTTRWPPPSAGTRRRRARRRQPWALAEYRELTGRDPRDDFPEWEPCHRQLLGNGIVGFENVGGDLDKVTGRRCTFAAFPIRWQYGDGSIVRLVAIVDPTGDYRIERGV